MSVFKSAMGYFSSSGANGGSDNEFVGQFVEIGNMKLRVKKVIAEGGFAFVYVAQDTASGTEYALKRLMAADEQANKNIIQEISLLKKLSGHANVIKYIAASFIDKTKTSHGMGEYLLLTDLCTGGSLMDALQNRGAAFPLQTILKVFYQTCRAVQHMHAQVPPIAHRDLKLENFLISNEGTIKLCDFGSATTEVFAPNPSWSANQRNMLEENLAQFTTPMYRAPEMLDTWDNYKIDHTVDIWALGCILYTLCYMQHPFEDSAKLAILNGNYTLNPNDQKFKCFHDIINGCLTVSPDSRMAISGMLERLAAIAESHSVNLKTPLKFERKKVEQSVATSSPATEPGAPPAPARPPRPAPPAPAPARAPPPAPLAAPSAPLPAVPPGAGGGLFSSIKGGAGSFLKNLKDTSSKVMQTVQQSIARTDLDISYITSRVIVMPYPSEGLESAYKTNHIEDVRAFLESRHPGSSYTVYSALRSPRALFPRQVRVADACPPAPHRAPLLAPLYMHLQAMYETLAAPGKRAAAVVVTCQDGKHMSCVLLCGLLLYAKLVAVPEDALQIFAVKRSPISIAPSQLRYLYYLSNIIRPDPIFPHFRSVTLVSLTIQPVPLFTKARDGCRPYIEIFNEDRLVLSTLQDYDRLHLYTMAEGKVSLPLDTTVTGDVAVCVYHARQQLGRATGVPVLAAQFHTGFLRDTHHIKFTRSELDGIEDGPNDHFPSQVTMTISLVILDGSRQAPRRAPWEDDHSYPVRAKDVLFSSTLERDETTETFANLGGKASTASSAISEEHPRPAQPPRPPRPTRPVTENPPASPATADFLNIAGQPQPAGLPQKTKLKSDDSFDFFGMMEKGSDEAFGDFLSGEAVKDNPEPFTSQPMFEDLPAPAPPAAPAAPAGAAAGAAGAARGFDPFGLNEPTQEPLLAPQLVPDDVTARPQSVPIERPSKPSDPFADLGLLGSAMPTAGIGANLAGGHGSGANLAGGLGSGTNLAGGLGSGTNLAGAHGSGTNLAGGLGSATNLAGGLGSATNLAGGLGSATNLAGGLSGATSPANTPQHQTHTPARSPQNQPDYSRRYFEPAKTPVGEPSAGKKPDVFGELLGSQGYEFGRREAGPRTMNAMRKEEVARDMDPEKLLIHDWTEGKKANIRALLCSLHTVVWEDCRWSTCNMAQLVSAQDVKKAYRKACLAVHPDKQMATPNENIAKMIFMELNNAWTEFESDTKQQNLFTS